MANYEAYGRKMIGAPPDYNNLDNMPKINNIPLRGNQTPEDLKIVTVELLPNGNVSNYSIKIKNIM